MARRDASEGARSRQRALAILLLRRTTSGNKNGLTLEEIAQQLSYDVFVDGRPQRQKAYEGSLDATRQQLHRDQKELRKNGIPVVCTVDRYTIDPNEIWTPRLGLTVEEQELLLSLRCSIGRPFGPSGLLPTGTLGRAQGNRRGAIVATLVRAKRDRHAVSFKYRKPGRPLAETRSMVPLRIVVSRRRYYVVGVDLVQNQVRGFLLERIQDVPQIVGEGANSVGTELVERAKAWTPRYQQDAALAVKFRVPHDFAEHQIRLLGSSVASASVDSKGNTILTVNFENNDDAIAFVVQNESNITKIVDRGFASTLKAWLAAVNTPTTASTQGLSFQSAFDPWGTDAAMQMVLEMSAVVMGSAEGMRASELAAAFGVDKESVIRNFSSLVLATDPTDKTRYLVPLTVGDDFDDDDPVYIADEFNQATWGDGDTVLWADVLEVQVMLQQIVRLAPNTDVARVALSIVEKIHNATDLSLSLYTPNAPFVGLVQESLGTRVLTINYQSAGQSVATPRRVVATEVQIVGDQPYVRAVDISLDTPEYRTYLASRLWGAEDSGPFEGTLPRDERPDWISEMLSEAREIAIEVDEQGLPIFENLPQVDIAPLGDTGRFVLRFRVASQRFLDECMAMAGAHAHVIEDLSPRAGHDLAQSVASRL